MSETDDPARDQWADWADEAAGAWAGDWVGATGESDAGGYSDAGGGGDAGGEQLGDEARRLVAAVQDWARRALPAPPSGHGGPECQWCPLCQLASVLRGEHPELAERMAAAASALSGAVTALVEAAARRGASPSAGATPAQAGDASPPPSTAQPQPQPRPRPRPGPQ